MDTNKVQPDEIQQNKVQHVINIYMAIVQNMAIQSITNPSREEFDRQMRENTSLYDGLDQYTQRFLYNMLSYQIGKQERAISQMTHSIMEQMAATRGKRSCQTS